MLAILCGGSASSAFAALWKFGVISDTQWSSRIPDDGKNPNTVAADIIRQIDAEFITQGVRLVVAVGDTVDKSSKASLDTRALYAQDLYNAGIAFYPLRGNHDAAWSGAGAEFARIFPQIGTGVNNNTPSDIIPAELIPAPDLAANPPAQKTTGISFTTGSNFSAPLTNATYQSLSYSLDYENARFVLLDQFDATGNTQNSTIAEQQEWISSRLTDPKRPMQAFVFGHKNLLGNAHKDSLFGSSPKAWDAANLRLRARRCWRCLFGSSPKAGDAGDVDPAQQAEQNRFIAALADNHVYYYISGHDHHHCESVVTSPDGSHSVHQIISASDSNMFVQPKPPFPDHAQPVSLDCNKIGYYIYTVDGPRVTMDYYGVDISGALDGKNSFTTTPKLTGNWKKIFSSGYSLEMKNKTENQP